MLIEDTLRLGLQVVNMLATLGLGAWMYIERRSDKTNDRVTTLGEKVDKLDKDLVGLATAAEGAPSHEDLTRLYAKIDATNDKLSETSDRVAKLSGSLDSLNDTLRVISAEIIRKGLSND